MGTAIIFDGNSILNRAFYGVRPLSAPDGTPTNAVYGFVNIIKKELSRFGVSPDYAAIAFDRKEKTFRHLACESYKATRKGMPEDLAVQLPIAKEVSEALGLTVIECVGYEADDILGTLSDMFCKNGDKCFIVTGDRDSFQLVNDCVTVLLAANDETKIVDPDFISEKYSLAPKQLIDVKSLMGDSSDNIKGVPGIGEKGAIKLIAEYGSLDGVYEHADSIKGSLGEKLRAGKESAFESRFLAEICLAAPIDADAESYKYLGDDIPALRAIYTKLGFKKHLDALGESIPAFTHSEYLPLPEVIPEGKKVYIHREGGCVFAKIGDSCYKTDEEDSDRLLASNRHFICWSAKEVVRLAMSKGITLGRTDDLSILSYLISPADNGISFDRVCSSLLDVNVSETDVALFERLEQKLLGDADEDIMRLYTEIELPLCFVLAEMEELGFGVSRDEMQSFSDALDLTIKQTEQAIYALAGEEFNINSTKQLGHILFEKLSLPHFKKTKSGYSTDVSVLEKLEHYHPIVPLILEYRKDAKLKNTYCDGLMGQIDESGRIHTTFKQTQTLTGRLSSAEPNLQNIPVRSEKGRELRRFFVAREGCVLIDADYSQIELRVLAHVSDDDTFRQAFIDGEDIHRITASQVFGLPPEFVTSDMRKKAKTVNFGIIYGMGDYSLSQDLHVSRREAAEYIESYLSKYPGVRDYMESVKTEAKEKGYVTTVFGRRRYVPEINSKNANIRAFGERVAMNTPIQGTAADLIKIAMIRASRMLAEAGLEAKLVLQIHDELIVEAPIHEAEKAKLILCEAMQGAADMAVPLTTDIGIGKSWFDAKQD